jgi:FkbH-like protein
MTDEDYARMLESVQENLRIIVDKINLAVDGQAPVFYLSFIEPPCSYQGTLLNNRRKSLYHTVRAMNDGLAGMLEDHPNAHYIEVNDLIRYFGDVKVTDAYLVQFTHAGLSGLADQYQFPVALVKRITHAVMILRAQAPVKLIITDLDNTLWKGVLAEVDQIVPHEHSEGWPLGYVESLLEFKRRGGLLAIASKNDEGPTLERFRAVWGSRMDLASFCSIKINWEPKSKNIQEILRETNLLPANALFIDDSPREIEEVRRVHPDLRVLTGEPTHWRNVILYSPHTQVARISSESSVRTETIQAKQQRDKMAEQMDRDSYLRSLDIRAKVIEIKGASHPKYARAAELINKTNQFNTTGKRWSEAEFGALFKAGGRIVALSATDRFGDNGLVAAAIVRGTASVQVVMSCRVFGLGLETALLSSVVGGILGSDHGFATASFQATGKNNTCATYFKDHGFLEDGEGWRTDRIPGSPDWIAWAE